MIFNILAAVLAAAALYQILAFFLKTPPLKQSLMIMRNRTNGNSGSKKTVSLIGNISKSLADYIPLSIAKEIRYSRMLQNVSAETPKEFVARIVVTCIIIAVLAILAAIITPWLAILPLVASAIAAFIIFEDAKDKAKKQHQAAEQSIPNFVEMFTHSVKTNRNVLSIFDTYIQNYECTPLSVELMRTVADMRTGDPDIALKRFEHRMNNPLLSQLVRGILATMRGEDMTAYFNDLVRKVNEVRKKLLTQKALKVVPKISVMSNARAFWAIGVLLYIAGMAILEYVKSTGSFG